MFGSQSIVLLRGVTFRASYLVDGKCRWVIDLLSSIKVALVDVKCLLNTTATKASNGLFNILQAKLFLSMIKL